MGFGTPRLIYGPEKLCKGLYYLGGASWGCIPLPQVNIRTREAVQGLAGFAADLKCELC